MTQLPFQYNENRELMYLLKKSSFKQKDSPLAEIAAEERAQKPETPKSPAEVSQTGPYFGNHPHYRGYDFC